MTAITFEISEVDKLMGRTILAEGFSVEVFGRYFKPTRKRQSAGRNVYLLKPEDIKQIREAWNGHEQIPGDFIGGGPGYEPYCRACGEKITAQHKAIQCRLHFFPKAINGYLHGHVCQQEK